MIHTRAIVITVTKTVVPGDALLDGLTRSFRYASKAWVGEPLPAYFAGRTHGRSGVLALELGTTPCDMEAITAWADPLFTVIGRAEIVFNFDPSFAARKLRGPRVEKKKVVSDGPIDRSMKPAEVVPALRPLLEPEGRKECDDIWCFLSSFVQKTPGDVARLEQFIAAMPETLPRLAAADIALKGLLTTSMRAIAEKRPGITMVCCCWALDLRDGRPDINAIRKKAKELIDFIPPMKPKPAMLPDDDGDAEWAATKFF